MYTAQSTAQMSGSHSDLRTGLGHALRTELGLEASPAPATFGLGAAQAAVRHGVAWPLREAAWADDSATAVIQRALRRQGRASLLQAVTIGEVSARLAEVSVRSLAYKGVALSAQTTGNLAARAPVDIDLLVDPSGVATAHRILVGMGWHLKPGTLPVPTKVNDLTQRLTCEIGFGGRKPTIDLHWRTEPTRRTLNIGFDAMWTDSVDVSAGSTVIRTLSPMHALLVTAVHGTRSRWASWKWIVDAARQIYEPNAPDLTDAYALARRVGAERSLQLAHGLAADLLEETPPVVASARMHKLRQQVWTGDWSQTIIGKPRYWLRDGSAAATEFVDRERCRYITADTKRAAMVATITPFLRRGISTFRHT